MIYVLVFSKSFFYYCFFSSHFSYHLGSAWCFSGICPFVLPSIKHQTHVPSLAPWNWKSLGNSLEKVLWIVLWTQCDQTGCIQSIWGWNSLSQIVEILKKRNKRSFSKFLRAFCFLSIACSFKQSFDKYLLSTYSVLDILLGMTNLVVNELASLPQELLGSDTGPALLTAPPVQFIFGGPSLLVLLPVPLPNFSYLCSPSVFPSCTSLHPRTVLQLFSIQITHSSSPNLDVTSPRKASPTPSPNLGLLSFHMLSGPPLL